MAEAAPVRMDPETQAAAEMEIMAPGTAEKMAETATRAVPGMAETVPGMAETVPGMAPAADAGTGTAAAAGTTAGSAAGAATGIASVRRAAKGTTAERASRSRRAAAVRGTGAAGAKEAEGTKPRRRRPGSAKTLRSSRTADSRTDREDAGGTAAGENAAAAVTAPQAPVTLTGTRNDKKR
jgi:hypothetical protein